MGRSSAFVGTQATTIGPLRDFLSLECSHTGSARSKQKGEE